MKLAEMFLNTFHWEKFFDELRSNKLPPEISSNNITVGV